MIDKIIEIAQDGRYLSVDRGFMVVSEKNIALGRIPLDSICAVIANAHGITYSNNLLAILSELGIPLVICGANHNPVGFLWSVSGHHAQAGRMDAQLEATKPQSKQLWKQIIRSKIEQQANLLDMFSKNSLPLRRMIEKVTSGDVTNVEAEAARYYWVTAFGKDFRRNRRVEGINSMLNYGYTVLRAATARAVIAAGLHPTLGICHKNAGNPMRLVDDLMEPFRPAVDYAVLNVINSGSTKSVTQEVKKNLVSSLSTFMKTDNGTSTVAVCIQNLASSLGTVYQGTRKELSLPIALLP